MSSEVRLKRLRWLCTHRAQLEMDVLLGNFLDKQFSKLSPEQEAAFIALAEPSPVRLEHITTGMGCCVMIFWRKA